MDTVQMWYCGAFNNILSYAIPVHPRMALEITQPRGPTHLLIIRDADAYLAATPSERNNAVRELLKLNRVKDIPKEPLVKWEYVTRGQF